MGKMAEMDPEALEIWRAVAVELETGGTIATFCEDEKLKKHFPAIHEKAVEVNRLEREVDVWCQQYFQMKMDSY